MKRTTFFMSVSLVALAAGFASTACTKKQESAQKNFVAKFSENSFVHLVAWPAYDPVQSERLLSLAQKAKSFSELSSQVQAENFDSLTSPDLCWYGRVTDKKLTNDELVSVYTRKDAAYSTTHPVSCTELMNKIQSNPDLQGFHKRLMARAEKAGADACVYLLYALTPRFGEQMLARMRTGKLTTEQEDRAIEAGVLP